MGSAQRPLVISPHAVERYRERVKAHLDLVEAEAELRALVDMWDGTVLDTCSLDTPDSENDAGYAEIAPGIFLGLDRNNSGNRLVAVTCLTNAALSEETRKRRNRAKAKARQAKRKSTYRAGRPATRGSW